jgi:DNA-binding transcriptional MerR regulator
VPRTSKKAADDPDLPKYSIAVASDLSGVPQQQLRRMEEAGLVAPARTHGNTRRYSDHDLARIDEVNDLANEGINAAGINHILSLRDNLQQLRADNKELSRQVDELRGADSLQAAPHKRPDMMQDNSASSASGKGSRRRRK